MGGRAPAAPSSCSLTPISILSLYRKSHSPRHPGLALPHLQPAVVALQPHRAASDRGTGQLSPSYYTCWGSLTSDYTACPLSLVLGKLQGSSKACHLWRPPRLPVPGHGAGPAGQDLQETPLGLRKAHPPRLDTPMPETLKAGEPEMPDRKGGTPRPCSQVGIGPCPRKPWQVIGRPQHGPQLLPVEELSPYSFWSRTRVPWAEVRPQPPTICPFPAPEPSTSPVSDLIVS